MKRSIISLPSLATREDRPVARSTLPIGLAKAQGICNRVSVIVSHRPQPPQEGYREDRAFGGEGANMGLLSRRKRRKQDSECA